MTTTRTVKTMEYTMEGGGRTMEIIREGGGGGGDGMTITRSSRSGGAGSMEASMVSSSVDENEEKRGFGQSSSPRSALAFFTPALTINGNFTKLKELNSPILFCVSMLNKQNITPQHIFPY